MRRKTHWIILVCLGLAWPAAVQASGSYTARPPRVPVQKDIGKLDNDKYSLGKSIFTGKAKLKPEADATAAQQEVRLKELATKLPKSAKEGEKLPGLAGKLTAKELEALEYYVAQRYKTK